MENIKDPLEKSIIAELKSTLHLKDKDFKTNKEGRVIELNLSYKKLKYIPDNLEYFHGLQRLDLHKNSITSLEHLEQFFQLTKLDLAENQINDLGTQRNISLFFVVIFAMLSIIIYVLYKKK